MNADEDGLYKELTYRVIGALYEVHNELGYNHKKNLYMKVQISVLICEKICVNLCP